MTEFTQSELREIFDYDPATGFLTWRRSPGRRVAAGARAGCETFQRKRKDRDGNPVPCRREVQIRAKLYAEARIIWCHFHGYWPSETEVIDHRNTDPFDNRIANLRPASQIENARNCKRRWTRKSSLPKWVYRQGARYTASVRAPNGRLKHLGSFPTPDDAHRAASDFARQLHGPFFQPGDPSFQ